MTKLQSHLDGVCHMLLGALLTLTVLQAYRGDFAREMGLVSLALLPLVALDLWLRWSQGEGTSGLARPLPDIHSILAILFGSAAAILFAAEYVFGVTRSAPGSWCPGCLAT